MKLTPARSRCPVEFTLDVVCGKYKPLLLWHLQTGVMRFSELRRRLPHASAKMMTRHLRELEEDGLVSRKVYPVIPPKVEYSLTQMGISVLPVLEAMCEWGQTYQPNCAAGKIQKGKGKPLVHTASSA